MWGRGTGSWSSWGSLHRTSGVWLAWFHMLHVDELIRIILWALGFGGCCQSSGTQPHSEKGQSTAALESESPQSQKWLVCGLNSAPLVLSSHGLKTESKQHFREKVHLQGEGLWSGNILFCSSEALCIFGVAVPFSLSPTFPSM